MPSLKAQGPGRPIAPPGRAPPRTVKAGRHWGGQALGWPLAAWIACAGKAHKVDDDGGAEACSRAPQAAMLQGHARHPPHSPARHSPARHSPILQGHARHRPILQGHARHSSAQPGAAQPRAAQPHTARKATRGTAPHSPARHSPAQHSRTLQGKPRAAQPRTARRGTAPRSTAPIARPRADSP